MARRETRDAIVKYIYSSDFLGDSADISIFLENYDGCRPNAIEKDYFNEIVSGVSSKNDEFNELIEKYADNWKLDRMSKIDIAILRVAIYEILYRDDIPDNVAINEAVELAKKYSYEDAGKFVNGILGAVYRENK